MISSKVACVLILSNAVSGFRVADNTPETRHSYAPWNCHPESQLPSGRQSARALLNSLTIRTNRVCKKFNAHRSNYTEHATLARRAYPCTPTANSQLLSSHSCKCIGWGAGIDQEVLRRARLLLGSQALQRLGDGCARSHGERFAATRRLAAYSRKHAGLERLVDQAQRFC